LSSISKYNLSSRCFSIIVFILCAGFGSAQRQPSNNAPLQVMFIYNFTRYIQWEMEPGQKNFRIGTLGADSLMRKELNKLTITARKIHSLPLKITHFKTLREVSHVEVLYIDFSEVKNIKVGQFGKQTLIVTANNPDLNNTMISFFKDDEKMRFAMNTIHINKAGLKYSPELLALASASITGADKETDRVAAGGWLDVFEKIEMARNADQQITLSGEEIEEVAKRIETQKKTLSEKEEMLDDLWKKIETKERTLSEQNQKIEEQLTQIKAQQARLRQQEKMLAEQDAAISGQQYDIRMQAGRLKRQEKALQYTIARNREQQRDLLRKQKEARQLALNIMNQRKVLHEHEMKIRRQFEKINLQRLTIFLALCVLVMVIFLSIIIYRSLLRIRLKNRIIADQKNLVERQKREVESQKRVIEQKNREMMDSINYAMRIQRALLASEKLLKENLRSYFQILLPKDVVSGDFYWAAILTDGRFALVTADSTGHGVPGAIMSMLNIACLNEAVEARRLVEPADILNHVRKSIIRHLSNDGSAEGGKDGMDCSLVVYDFKNLIMTYAAANDPVWIVRNGGLIELEPDKMPVGRHERDTVPFVQHTVQLQDGDMIYTLTDGLPDQFGGPRGKKFMYRQLKDLLTGVAGLDPEVQKERIINTLHEWKGSLEQVDDITVIGIRI
jgi:serine phosphatase RsbU (regulator of sigma subunit)